MYKFFNFVCFALYLVALLPQNAFALGKTANVMTCQQHGTITIETMVYDSATERPSDGVLQLNGRAFFDLTPTLRAKMSKTLASGHVDKTEKNNQISLLGYMEESSEFSLAAFPSGERTQTQAWKGNSPGTLKMNIEGNSIACEFTNSRDIYTKVLVSFNYDDQTYNNLKEKEVDCNVSEGVRTYTVKWFTDKDSSPVKSETILASCGYKKGAASYDAPTTKITIRGRVEVDLKRKKILHRSDGDLSSRHHVSAPAELVPLSPHKEINRKAVIQNSEFSEFCKVTDYPVQAGKSFTQDHYGRANLKAFKRQRYFLKFGNDNAYIHASGNDYNDDGIEDFYLISPGYNHSSYLEDYTVLYILSGTENTSGTIEPNFEHKALKIIFFSKIRKEFSRYLGSSEDGIIITAKAIPVEYNGQVYLRLDAQTSLLGYNTYRSAYHNAPDLTTYAKINSDMELEPICYEYVD